MNENLFAALNQPMSAAPDKTALLLSEDRQISFGQLLDRAGSLCTLLEELGVQADDRILVQVDKSVANVVLYLATLQLGAVYVPINTAYTREEVQYFLDDAQPALLVLDDVTRCSQLTLTHGSGAAQCYALGACAEDAEASQSVDSLLQRSASLPAQTRVAQRSAADMAAILYTSGTTGRSKGAMLSHGNLLSNARTLLDLWGWRKQDVLLHALPIFHVHGLFVALHCAFLGASTIIFRPAFNAADVCTWLGQATVMMGVPTFYTRLLSEPQFDQTLVSGMRLFISGSAPLTEQTFAAFEARSGHRILERYGMSETLMNTSNPLNGERVPGSVGYALPGVELRVVDDHGAQCAAEAVGEIEVRGVNVFAGYWQMPEKTAAEFRNDGFFRTGDLATRAADGRVAIVGRGKDLVISGGYNVYPKEVERLLDTMPGVVESAVIGVPHADFGEAVVAVIVAEPDKAGPDLSSVSSFLQERVARYKQPKHVALVAQLPRNAMGKVQKNGLREAYKDLFKEP
ncbi:MAG: AMP-binding protein [Pseudomonadales bacterium]